MPTSTLSTAERHHSGLPSLDFMRARDRIRSLIWRTPVLPVGTPSGEVALKLESLQRTGSFKVRGAANRILKLNEDERHCGIVAASSGNHGRAVAEVARQLGIAATVCVPDWADPSKLEAIRAAGARVILSGTSYDEAEDRAAELAGPGGMTLVHPFDDPDVIEGQGTIALELAEQLPGLDEILVPLSGGGLVAGIGLVARALGLRVVAVSARRASVMVRSVRAGRPVRVPDEETVASALSGGIGLDNRFTFNIVRDVVAEHVVVEEPAIRAAVARCFHDYRLVVEGGGAVGIAALWSGYQTRGHAAVIVSGGNIDPATLSAIATDAATSRQTA